LRQQNDGCVNSDDIAELLERRSERVRDSDLLDGVVEEVAQERRQLIGKSVVEARWEDRLIGCRFVGTPIASDKAGFAA
jgi:hypothetical protein